MKKIFLILSILSLALSPIVVGAAETCTEYCDNPNTETMPDGQVCYCNPLGNEDSDKSLSVIIEPIINFIFNLSVVVVPVLVITGAFLITTAGGDEERIKKGKDI